MGVNTDKRADTRIKTLALGFELKVLRRKADKKFPHSSLSEFDILSVSNHQRKFFPPPLFSRAIIFAQKEGRQKFSTFVSLGI
jgi:hypothetical protein